MDKTLQTIQTVAKIGKILSTIAYVFCIIGLVGCGVGLIVFGTGMATIQLGEINLGQLIADTAGMTDSAVTARLSVEMIVTAGELIVAYQAKEYFKRELAAGTPFTLEGASKLMRLGIVSIVAPLVAAVIAAIVYAVMQATVGNLPEWEPNSALNVGMGATFIVASLLCRYGAERENQ